MRHTIICYNAPSEVLWKTASEPAPFLFLEGNILELTAAKRLDIDVEIYEARNDSTNFLMSSAFFMNDSWTIIYDTPLVLLINSLLHPAF